MPNHARLTAAILMAGTAMITTSAYALDLGVDLGGVGVDVSLDSGGLDVGASVGDTVDAGASVSTPSSDGGAGIGASVDAGPISAGVDAGSGGVSVGAGAGPVSVDAGVGQGGISANVGAGPVDVGASAGSGGIDANVGAGPISTGVAIGQPVPANGGAVLVPGFQPGVQPQQQAVPAAATTRSQAAPQRRAAPPKPPRSKTISDVDKATSKTGDERLDILLDLVSDSRLVDTDLDDVVDDRRVVIIYLDDLLDEVAREKVYRAIRFGAAGYQEVRAAIAVSDELKEILTREGVGLDEVIAIQVGLDGTTEVLVSERARIVTADERTPVIWDAFARSYFPIKKANDRQHFAWRYRTRIPMISALAVQQPVLPPSVVRVEPMVAPAVVRQPTVQGMPTPRCSVVSNVEAGELDYLSAGSWSGGTIDTETVIPGWDMNGVVLNALAEENMALVSDVMVLMGEPMEDVFLQDQSFAVAETDLSEYEALFDDLASSENVPGLILASHAAAQTVSLPEIAITEDIVASLETIPGGFLQSASFVGAQLQNDCDPQTFRTLQAMGYEPGAPISVPVEQRDFWPLEANMPGLVSVRYDIDYLVSSR